MTETCELSPSGGRAMPHARFPDHNRQRERHRTGFIVDEQLRKARGSVGAATPFDKWKLVRGLTEARAFFGLSDRTIAVAEALLSFHGERTLSLGAAGSLVVFPSNAELSVRARGMAPATLRRHLAALVEAGLILRRDSANGKRYARRGEDGALEAAFGFDLSPLLLKAPEIEREAARARAEAAAVRALRSDITIQLRDIARLIEAFQGEEAGSPAPALFERLQTLSGRLGRRTERPLLERRLASLLALRRDVDSHCRSAVAEAPATPAEPSFPEEMSANVHRNERHIENADSESLFDSKAGGFVPEPAEPTAVPQSHSEPSSDPVLTIEEMRRRFHARANRCQAPQEPSLPVVPAVPLESVLRACPTIRDYAPAGLTSWRDLLKAADVVRATLGVSPDGWSEARRVLGPLDAAIVMAAVLEKAETVRSPGGYLRGITRQAAAGGFALKPMLATLMAGRGRSG